jgi:hypothetical protein
VGVSVGVVIVKAWWLELHVQHVQVVVVAGTLVLFVNVGGRRDVCILEVAACRGIGLSAVYIGG